MAIDVTKLNRSSNTNKKNQLIRQKTLIIRRYIHFFFLICATLTLSDLALKNDKSDNYS